MGSHICEDFDWMRLDASSDRRWQQCDDFRCNRIQIDSALLGGGQVVHCLVVVAVPALRSSPNAENKNPEGLGDV